MQYFSIISHFFKPRMLGCAAVVLSAAASIGLSFYIFYATFSSAWVIIFRLFGLFIFTVVFWHALFLLVFPLKVKQAKYIDYAYVLFGLMGILQVLLLHSDIIQYEAIKYGDAKFHAERAQEYAGEYLDKECHELRFYSDMHDRRYCEQLEEVYFSIYPLYTIRRLLQDTNFINGGSHIVLSPRGSGRTYPDIREHLEAIILIDENKRADSLPLRVNLTLAALIALILSAGLRATKATIELLG